MSSRHMPRRGIAALAAMGLTVALAPLLAVATAAPSAAAPRDVLTGKVESDFGLWLKGITVDAYRWSADGTSLEHVATDVTDSEGDYGFASLSAGDYVLHFDDEAGDFLPEYWRDADDAASATLVHVEPPTAVALAPATVTNAGHLLGIAAGVDGHARGDVLVKAYRLDPATSAWDQVAEDTTAADGSYDLAGLEEGTYRLEFVDAEYGSEFWTTRWYDYQQDVHELALASDIVVPESTTTVDLDVQLGIPAITSPPTVLHASPVRISGTPAVGTTLWGDPGTWSPLPEHLSFQWLADDVPILGATESDYVPVTADVGKQLRLRVTADRSGYANGTDISLPTAAVVTELGPAPWNTAPTYIVGTPRVGDTVSVNPGQWDLPEATMSYQWLVDDVPIAGATGPTYTPVAADLDKKLRVAVTAQLPGHLDGSDVAASQIVRRGKITPTRYPRVKGKPVDDAVLVVDTGRWSAADATVTVQWYAGAKPIAGATSVQLWLHGRVARAVKGKFIRVRISVSAPGYRDGSFTLKLAGMLHRTSARLARDESTLAVSVVTPPTLSTDLARIGDVVVADPGLWDPADSSTSLQWLVDGAPVAGATGPTFTATQADVHKTLQVQVTASKDGYADGVATSDLIMIRPAIIVVTTPPQVHGHVARGQTLTLETGTWTPTDTAVRVQWYSGRDAMPWATRTTLKLVGRTAAAVTRKAIRVRIWLTSPGDSTPTRIFLLELGGRVR
jgi:5-hydroxyisourate hydrolase-like protein (transthyretin family)